MEYHVIRNGGVHSSGPNNIRPPWTVQETTEPQPGLEAAGSILLPGNCNVVSASLTNGYVSRDGLLQGRCLYWMSTVPGRSGPSKSRVTITCYLLVLQLIIKYIQVRGQGMFQTSVLPGGSPGEV